MRRPSPPTIAVFAALLAASAFASVPVPSAGAPRTENVFIVVVDGVRYSESFGDPEHRHIPEMSGRLASLGVVNRRFYNDGHTKTVSGHASILTGTRQHLANHHFGEEHPEQPTIFERWRKQHGRPQTDTLLATSKRKLKGLAYSRAAGFGRDFRAATDVPGTSVPLVRMISPGYRDDEETLAVLLQAMAAEKPRLVLVNLREPDTEGHAGDWEGYLAAIRKADGLVGRLWDRIEADPFYAGRTTLIVTNDHGRHLDRRGGFEEHGCSCEGCQRIFFLALGPDFAPGREVETRRALIDIAPTVGRLLGIEAPKADGEVMTELFAPPGSLALAVDLGPAAATPDAMLDVAPAPPILGAASASLPAIGTVR